MWLRGVCVNFARSRAYYSVCGVRVDITKVPPVPGLQPADAVHLPSRLCPLLLDTLPGALFVSVSDVSGVTVVLSLLCFVCFRFGYFRRDGSSFALVLCLLPFRIFPA